MVDGNLVLSTAFGIPIGAYCLILGFLAFRADRRAWFSLEAQAVKKDYEKKTKKGRARYKYKFKFLFLYCVLAYEFFQLMSFGLSTNVPWTFPKLTEGLNNASLVPKGKEISTGR